ncbi:MAG: glycosyltransferase [Prolixibacteraceae bacterium]|nr:glycosyltransferase [Prolixibacteraceae bacterium]
MPEELNLPRVLIYGETFRKLGGGGITLKTLFGDWPIDNIYMLCDKYNDSSDVHFVDFYKIGNLETKTILNRIGIKKTNIKDSETSENIKPSKSSMISKKSSHSLYIYLKNFFISIIRFIGIYELFFTTKVSPELINWVTQIKPDIIYFQPSSIENIKFLIELNKKTGVPYVVHIMDNFFDIVLKETLLKNKNELLFNELIKNSNLCLSICDEMSRQYEKRFKRSFYAYQHAVDYKFWHKNYQVRKNPEPFIILYAGRIGIGTKNSLFILAKAIQNLNDKHDTNFEFQIQTTSKVPEVLKKISSYKCVKIQSLVPYEELPHRFASADLLVLPMDFEINGLTYIKLSMPTKVPEYLVAGVPILVFAHEITALYKYAKKESWAFTINSENLKNIENILIEIRNDYKRRVQFSKTAQRIGIHNHNIHNIRNSFKKQIIRSCVNKI